jgi:hypothetical protein
MKMREGIAEKEEWMTIAIEERVEAFQSRLGVAAG